MRAAGESVRQFHVLVGVAEADDAAAIAFGGAAGRVAFGFGHSFAFFDKPEARFAAGVALPVQSLGGCGGPADLT